MDKRELTSVALIALAAILIANPMYTGKWNSGEPNIEVSAKSVGSVDSTVLRNLSRPLSDSLLHNPNVTDFETLSENETRVVNATLSKGGILIRYVNRSDLGQKYRRIFGNKSFPTYARRGGYLRIDGELYDFTLTVNRRQRALEGNIDKVNETVVVTASRDYLSASLKDVFGKATQGGYRLASANATSANASENVSANPTNPLGVYDFVVSDGSVYRTETEERGNSTFVVANRVQKSSLFDSLSTSVGDIPSPERGQIRGAIENGKTLYKQPGDSLRSYKFVEHQGNYYLMTYSKKSPSMLEVLDTPNIVGMLLGVIVLLGGFWQMYDLYRDKV